MHQNTSSIQQIFRLRDTQHPLIPYPTGTLYTNPPFLYPREVAILRIEVVRKIKFPKILKEKISTILNFLSNSTIYKKIKIITIMSTGKRIYRDVDDATKQKISQKMSGRSKTPSHIQAISNGMRRYWSTIPSRPKTNDNTNPETSPDEVVI